MARILSNIKQKIENKSDFYTLPYTKDTMKGLSTFINDIRHCKSRAAEIKRVNKELANIRSKFRADKNIDGYHKKKYVAKLIFIHLLGYDVNFGQSEAIYLLCSNKFSEKQIGYLFLSMLPDTDDDQFCKSMVSSISADMRSHNLHFVILAAHCVPNVLCREIINEIGNDMLDLLKSNNNDQITQALLSCYLAMIKFDHQYFKQNQSLNEYLMRLFVSANDTLLLPLADIFYQGSQMEPVIFAESVSGILSQIQNLTKPRSGSNDHVYYGVQSPWTIIKLLQCVQAFPIPASCEAQINSAVLATLSMARVVHLDLKKIHPPNICNAIAFEAVNVIAAKNLYQSCAQQAVAFLIDALRTSVNNYRYFALESMLKIKDMPGTLNYMAPVVPLLIEIVTKETNTPLRLKSVDVMYAICEPQMLREIVDSLMDFLRGCELNVREELTLKISMMAMKVLNEDIRWFVDTMMRVLEYAGQDSSEDIWHKILHVITNYPAVRNYAARIAISYMVRSNSNEKLVMLSAYILGEFGEELYNFDDSSPQIQATLLLDFFPFVDQTTKYIILTALFKIASKSPAVRAFVTNFLGSDAVTKNIDCEIQQRCCEYLMILKNFENMLPTVLEVMPEYMIEEANDACVKPSSSYSADRDDRQMSESSVKDYNVSQMVIDDAIMLAERPKKKGVVQFYDYKLYYEVNVSGSSGFVSLLIEPVTRGIDDTPKVTKVSTSRHDDLSFESTTSTDPSRVNYARVNFTCMKEVFTSAKVQIEFIHERIQKSVTFVLPVYLEHFFSPYKTTLERFLSIWDSFGPESEQSLKFPISSNWGYSDIITYLTKDLSLESVPEAITNQHDKSLIGVFTSEGKTSGFVFLFIADEAKKEVNVRFRCVESRLGEAMKLNFTSIFKLPKM